MQNTPGKKPVNYSKCVVCGYILCLFVYSACVCVRVCARMRVSVSVSGCESECL